MGVFQARGRGEGRVVALVDAQLCAGGPFVSACHGKSGWEVWLWVQRGRVSGSVSSLEAPSVPRSWEASERDVCVFVHVWKSCVFTEKGF